MNNVRINFTIDSLSHLDSLGGNNYRMVVKALNSAGQPLNNPNIPNESTITVNATGTTFFANLPITDGSYSIPNVTFMAYANDLQDCCIASTQVNIVNTPSNNCNMNVAIQFAQCNGIIAADISGGVAPYTISIQTTTDTTERYASSVGSFRYFTVKNGSHIYRLKVTDSTGCVVTKEVSLSCGVSAPDFQAEIVQPTCVNNAIQVGYVKIKSPSNATRYKICYNATFNCGDCQNSDGVINQNGETTIYIFAPAPGQTSAVSIRVFSGNGCESFTDINFNQTSPACAPNPGCNMSIVLGSTTCSEIPITITNGVGPYEISVLKVAEGFQRFRGFDGAKITYEPAFDGVQATYNVLVKGANGCSATASFNQTCSTPPTNYNPSGTMEVVQPTCVNGGISPGYIRLYNMQHATSYKVCDNASTFTCGDCQNRDGTIEAGKDKVIYIYPPAQGQTKFTTIRIFNGSGCELFLDATAQQTSPTCGQSCNANLNIGPPVC